MTVNTTKLGPGTFTLGDETALQDWSCQLEALTVSWAKNKDDDVRMLCGDVKPGATTYTAQLTGTIDQDLAVADGAVFYSWTNRGKAVPFTYTPSTAAGASVTGTVTVDPFDVGGDTGGDDMTSDFTWDCVGEPQLSPGGTLELDTVSETVGASV